MGSGLDRYMVLLDIKVIFCPVSHFKIGPLVYAVKGATQKRKL